MDDREFEGFLLSQLETMSDRLGKEMDRSMRYIEIIQRLTEENRALRNQSEEEAEHDN